MITTSRRTRKAPPKPKRLSIRDWQKGKISTQDSNRTPQNGLKTALNGMLKQDGTAAPRPSRVLYGPQPLGTVLGEINEFTKRTVGTSTNYLISVQVVAGVARCYYARGEDTTWTIANGKTFNTTARCHFCPIRDIDTNYVDEDKVLILNGEDNLSYLDINTLTVVPFVSLATPAAPSVVVGAGLTGTNFPNRYKVTAGNRGETAASPVATGTNTTSKLRSEWAAATEYIDVTITRVTGAQKYHIYYGTETGEETYLFSIDDPGSGATVTWRDSGIIDPNIYRPAPVGDTTAGPIGTRASFINGQVFVVGDKNNVKYVRYGGTGRSILDFSPYGGGGYEPVGGNKETPVNVKPFRKNDGTPAITVICKGTNGFGKRYIFTPATIGNVSYFAVSEENGNDGTEAPDSVILHKDQLWYLSRDGAKTTLTKAQVQTILSTEGVSDLIEKDIDRLNTMTLELSVGLTFENRLYWLVAAGGSATNNEMWVLDLSDLRRGAWMLPWPMNATWMYLYNDNSGNTHFCTVENNQILEFTDSVATQDNGVAFPTGFSTGLLKFSEDGQEWAQVIRVIFVVQRPQGRINVAVNGKTEDDPLSLLGSEPFESASDIVGWSENEWSAPYAWSEIALVPSAYGIEQTEIEVEIDEELNWLNCDLGSLTANTDYEWTDCIVEYINTGTKR